MEMENKNLESLVMLNIVFLIVNALIVINYDSFSDSYYRSHGGAILFQLVFGLLLLVHFTFICVILYTKNFSLLRVASLLSLVLTVVIYLQPIKNYFDNLSEQRAMERDRKKRTNYLKGIGINNDERHTQFTMAIADNDTAKVYAMITEGERVTNEDLYLAIDLYFKKNKTISFSIFEKLLAHGSDIRQDIRFILCAINSHTCSGDHARVLELFLRAGATPTPYNEFHLTCLPKLKLLLRYGASINLLTRVNYNSAPDGMDKSYITERPHWTPIMIYLEKYPDYFEETKFLLANHPDLNYKDENGFTIELLLQGLMNTSNNKRYLELTEFQKDLRKQQRRDE